MPKDNVSPVRLTQTAGEPPVLMFGDVDMSRRVLADGFKLTYDAENYQHHVHVVIPAEVLDVDLPEVVVHALREGA